MRSLSASAVLFTASLILWSAMLLPSVAAAAPPEAVTTARQQLKENDPEGAARTLKAALRQSPNSALLHNELGVALFQQQKYPAAASSFDAATKADPKFATAWANLGEAHRLSGKFKHGAVAFHRYLQLEKGDRYAIYGLGLCFEGYESFDKALKTFQVAEKAAQGDDRLLARIQIAFRRVRLKIAQARMPLLDRGDAHLSAGRWKQALDFYQQGLKKAPGDAQLLGRRGLVRAILGELPSARADLEAALIADATEPVARAAYALVLEATGGAVGPLEPARSGVTELEADRPARAIRAFAATLRVDPEAREARLGHAEAQLRLGKLDTAQEEFTAAGGKDGAAGVAEVHWQRGDRSASDDAANRAGAPTGARLPLWRRSLLLR